MSQAIIRSLTLTGATATLTAATGASQDQGWWLGTAAEGSMEGWWTPPAPRAETKNRPQADGAFAPASLLVGARVLTIVLHHAATTSQEERQARTALAALSRGWLRVVVEEDGRTLHVRGFVSAQVKATHRTGTVSTWSLIITCPDPLIYEGPGSDDEALSGWRCAEGLWSPTGSGGLLFDVFDQAPREDVSSTAEGTARFSGAGSSSLLVDSPGTEPTWPVLEVDGPVSWARWSLGDAVVRWDGVVPEGFTLRVNTQDGMCTLGGVRVSQAPLSRADFFALPVGVSAVAVEADRPATFRVRWLPAWI